VRGKEESVLGGCGRRGQVDRNMARGGGSRKDYQERVRSVKARDSG
jgi:hypothetical protein